MNLRALLGLVTNLIVTAAAAVTYAALAWLSILPSLPAEGAALIWAPSGFAVGALLLLGARWVGPGLLLGALGINLWAFANGAVAQPLVPATLIALGAIAQSIVAAHLLRRFVPWAHVSAPPPQAPHPRQPLAVALVRFAAIAALAATIAPSINVAALLWAGLAPRAATEWGAAWLSSFLGILLITPPMVALGRWQHALASLRLPVMVIVNCGVLISIAICFGVWALETQRVRVEFAGSARAVAFELEQTLDTLEHNLEVIKALYASSSRVTPTEFRSMTRPHLHDSQTASITKAIAWVPYPVSPAQPQRPASQIRAAYVEPQDSPWGVIEGTLNADPAARAAFARARDRDQIAMIAPIPLGDGAPGMLLLQPTYRRDLPTNTVADRQANIIGFVVGVYDLHAMMEMILIVPEARDINFYLFDQSNLDNPQLLLTHAAQSHTSPPNPNASLAIASLADQDSYASALRVAGQTWLLTARPTPAFLSSRRTLLPWGALLGGLIITALAMFYIAQRQGASRALLDSEAHEQRRRAMLEQVIHLGKTITQLADLQQCLRQIHHSIRQGLGFDRVGLFFYEAEAEQIRGALGTDRAGALEDISDYVEPMQGATWSEVFLDPHGISFTDDYTALHQLTTAHKMYGVRQHVALLAWVGERPIALITVDNLISGRAFTPEQIEALQLFAGYAGLAIENARWSARLERRVAERTDELNRANLELTRAMRTKDEFLATMSHELRTPLNSILGLSEALAEETRGPLNSHQRRSVQAIEASGRHLLALINDILDMAKIEAGKVELQIEATSVEALCRSSLALVSEMAARKRLQITYRPDEGALQIAVDPRRLKQILVNLLSNAVKFTGEGGAIGLEVRGDAAREVLHFSVCDSGIGIAEQDMSRLFQPFTQLDSGLARHHEGTGLGLALVQRLTELHGGHVSVASAGAPGQGSTFTVTLPWRATAPTAAPPRPATAPLSPLESRAPAPAQPRKLILLAEDNETNIQAMADYIEYLGYQLVIARNGQEAIERACAALPDLILMDIQMPVLDGLEAIRQLRAMPAFAATPIIALTALAMPGDRERCLEAGASEYVSKPVSLKGLATTITRQLHGERQ